MFTDVMKLARVNAMECTVVSAGTALVCASMFESDQGHEVWFCRPRNPLPTSAIEGLGKSLYSLHWVRHS